MSPRAIRILAFIICAPALISIIACNFGMLKLGHMIAINLAVIIAETILLIVTMKKIAEYTRIMSGVTIPKSKFINKYIKANNEILSENIKPVHPSHNGIFRVIMELIDKDDKPLKLYVIRKHNFDIHEQEIDIIEPSKIKKHIFELSIDPREIINFKFDRDTTVMSFSVDELYIP